MPRRRIPVDLLEDFLPGAPEDPMAAFATGGLRSYGREAFPEYYTPEQTAEAMLKATGPLSTATGEAIRQMGGGEIPAAVGEIGAGLLEPGFGEVPAAAGLLKKGILVGAPAVTKQVREGLLKAAGRIGGRFKKMVTDILENPERIVNVTEEITPALRRYYQKHHPGYQPAASYAPETMERAEKLFFNPKYGGASLESVAHEGGHALWRSIPAKERAAFVELVKKRGGHPLPARLYDDPEKLAEETLTNLLEDFAQGKTPKGPSEWGTDEMVVSAARKLLGETDEEELARLFFGQ